MINQKRLWMGAVAGGVVWSVWSSIVNFGILMPRYVIAQQAGSILQAPRYAFFTPVWFLTLFGLSFLVAWLYAASRTTLGPGPLTAVKIGFGVGFGSGFPIAFSLATWAPMGRGIPLWWMLDLWVGAILATIVAGWLYKE